MTHDYSNLGFKCGLEIHQQLDTDKLFCRCPSLVRDENPKVQTLSRRQRPVIGETGEVDAAAAFEALRSKVFVYEFRDTSSCLVELDEEPPHAMNPHALSAALQVAKLLHARPVDEIQVMRKIVVDGSNVSGFQRSSLIATDGYIETSRGRVPIPTIFLEEESAQKLEEHEHFVRYRLDRLGVPLIEIDTDPSIKDPAHALECAEKLGMILRSTDKVKRGIGSIRQDVNVSVHNGTRVEVKGFQELKSIPKVIDYEISRQLALIKKGKKVEGEVRKAEPDMTTSFLRPMPGAARLYPETDVLPVRITKEHFSDVSGVELLEDIMKKLVSSYHLAPDIAASLVKQKKANLFETLCTHKNVKAAFIADLLLGIAKQAKNELGVDVNPSDDDFKELIDALDQERIAKESIPLILASKKPVKEVISNYSLMSDNQLEKELLAIIAQHPGMPYNALIGKAMANLRGKAAGQKIAAMLKKLSA